MLRWPQKPMDAIVNYSQWKSIHTPLNLKQDQEKYEDQSKKISKKLQITSEEVLKMLLSHINTKRIQAKAFQDDLTKLNTRVLQTHYVMAYQCKY